MTIGISLLTLVPRVVGGSEVYVRALTRELHRLPDVDAVAFLPTIAPDAHGGLPHHVVRSYAASASTAGRLAAMVRATVAGGRVRRELQLDRLDVLHYPLTTMIPPVNGVPTVTSILDVQHEFFPQFFSPPERLYRKLVYGRAARRSTLVLAISRHAAETLTERLGVPPERIRVVPMGVDLATFRPGEEAREPFLLYPANRWPHKNHERLFAALAIVRASRPELRLVLTGAGHEGRPVPAGVEVLGHVPLERLADLYRRASALVFPSLYEGFGQPPVEAMASGCPVASSSAGGLAEVCGDAARLFDPTDPEAIAEAVLDVLRDPAPLVARGLERARSFTWEASARRHVDVYRELAP